MSKKDDLFRKIESSSWFKELESSDWFSKVKANNWSGKIESKEDAIKIIKDVSNGFLVLAGIQIGLGLLIGIEAIIDGVIYAVLALLLRKFNSRVVAILLLFLSLIAAVLTGINKFGGGQGGANIFLAFIMIYVSVRAIKATFKYNKLK